MERAVAREVAYFCRVAWVVAQVETAVAEVVTVAPACAVVAAGAAAATVAKVAKGVPEAEPARIQESRTCASSASVVGVLTKPRFGRWSVSYGLGWRRISQVDRPLEGLEHEEGGARRGSGADCEGEERADDAELHELRLGSALGVADGGVSGTGAGASTQCHGR